jgi:hypothetical protein
MNTLSVMTDDPRETRLSTAELEALADKVPVADLRLYMPKSIGEALRVRLLNRMPPQDALLTLRIQADLSQDERLLLMSRLTSEGALNVLLS